jgi:hypothetical protein
MDRRSGGQPRSCAAVSSTRSLANGRISLVDTYRTPPNGAEGGGGAGFPQATDTKGMPTIGSHARKRMASLIPILTVTRTQSVGGRAVYPPPSPSVHAREDQTVGWIVRSFFGLVTAKVSSETAPRFTDACFTLGPRGFTPVLPLREGDEFAPSRLCRGYCQELREFSTRSPLKGREGRRRWAGQPTELYSGRGIGSSKPNPASFR